MVLDESKSSAALAIANRLRGDVAPASLPVMPQTWRSLKAMGVDIDEGKLEFLDEGTHIWYSYFLHWGWWKTKVLGFYPYTELRDYEAHERQGIGRPWINLLSEMWQGLIFRELVLLTAAWNDLVVPESQFTFGQKEAFPVWMDRWLSLTNESWRRGATEFEREISDALQHPSDDLRSARLVQQYRASSMTWRPMMPEIALYHRKYGERPEYFSFERTTDTPME